MSDQDIAKNLKTIQQKIETAAREAGRDPSDITLVAVSKTKPASDIFKAIEAGNLHFGENRMKELED